MSSGSEPTEADPAGRWEASEASPPGSRWSGNAIAALVLSLFPTLGIASVLAIVFGVRARRDIAANPRLRGRGMATAGIVLGIIGLVVSILVWVLIITAFASGASR